MGYDTYTEFYFNELFPSAIMFGMSSTDFWENDPQLYWAYRTFYLKQQENQAELIRYNAWLNGNVQSIGMLVALNKAFSKNNVEYPRYEEMFDVSEQTTDKQGNKEPKRALTENEKSLIVQQEFNQCARFN